MPTRPNVQSIASDRPMASDPAPDDGRQALAVPEPLLGNVVLRLPKALVDKARRDLRRPHETALERVGFLVVTSARTEGDQLLVLGLEYQAIPDDQYVASRGAGTRIGTVAIRNAITRAMTGARGIFHIHLHEHEGIPHFSDTDRREQPRLAQSLVAAAPAESHGMIVLSADAANAWVWPADGDGAVVPARLVIVGDPMVLLSGNQLHDTIQSGDEALSSERLESEGTVRGRGAPVASVASFPNVEENSANGACAQPPRERYSRQSFLGPDSQRRLETARVAVLGYGGGGSHVGQQLAHVGVLHLRVADGDIIDESNLNRLVGGTAADVEEKRVKVDIARRVITGVLPSAPLITHDSRWQNRADLFRACDILVGCVDSFAERRELEVLARRFGIPYVDIGMDVHQESGEPPRMGGQVILSMPGGPCFSCLGFLTLERLAREAARYGAAGDRPQVVWPNGTLASAAVGLVVSLLTGWTGETDRTVYLSYDGNRGTLTPHPRLAYLGKAPCSHFPIEQMGLPRFTTVRPL